MTRPYDQYDEAALIERVLAGDREAFTPLVERYYSGILNLCVRLLGPISEAEDVAQEAVLHAYLGLPELRARNNPGAWMYAIAANRCRSILRRTKPTMMTDQDELQRLPCHRLTAEDLVADRELHHLILEAIDTLSDINREVVTGFYLDGYSYQELEHLLGIPIDRVKSRLFKARRNLKKALAPIAHDYITAKRNERVTMSNSDHIEMEIEQVKEQYTSDQASIIFKTIDKEQYLCLSIEQEERKAIETALSGDKQTMPIANNLAYRILEQLGGRVDHILVDQLVEQQCVARITISQDSESHALETRVGEAVALAVRCGAPIYVTARTIDAIGVSLEVEPNNPAVHGVADFEPDQRPHRELFDIIWRFIMDARLGGTDEKSITELRKTSWDDLFPSHEITWEGEQVQAIEVAYAREWPPRRSQKLWILAPKHIWDWIPGFESQLKDKRFPRLPGPTKPDPDMDRDLLTRIDRIMEDAFEDLDRLGLPAIALMSRNGKMISGYSEFGSSDAETMGINGIRNSRIMEYEEAHMSLPFFTNQGTYNRKHLDIYANMDLKSYRERATWSGSGFINGHWYFCYIGTDRADDIYHAVEHDGSGHNAVKARMRQLYNDLKALLPDYSEYYNMFPMFED